MNVKTAQISRKMICVSLLSMLCLFALNATGLAQSVEQPKIEIIKTANPITASPGDTVTYTYVIANTGNVTLTDITAIDDILGTITISPTALVPTSIGSGTVTLPDGSTVLAPAIVTATLTLVVGDDPSMLYNTATVTGTSPGGTDVTDSDEFEIGYPGSIGNRIWSILGEDIDPLEGVIVILTASDGTTQTATTDADGYYLFTNLPFDVYTVEVDISTLPAAKQGLSPTISSDGGEDSMTTVILSESRPNSVIEDFGYTLKPTAVSLSNVGVSTPLTLLFIGALMSVTAGAAWVAQRKS